MEKLRVAVFFGGRSAEHDVSIVSGLQTLDAIDTTRFDPFPVYIAENGQWYVGNGLRDRRNYPIEKKNPDAVLKADLMLSSSSRDGIGHIRTESVGLLKRATDYHFDVALPVLHGTFGEDGTFQGLMELAGIAYAGPRVKDAVITMDKVLAKNFFIQLGLPVLPSIPLYKPEGQDFFNVADLTNGLDITYPVCVKPAHLGSSIGVHKANNLQDLHAALLDIFGMDNCAVIEPFIENLVEYNVAVTKATGEARLSVIERPINDKNGDGNVLDFKAKYQSSDDKDSKLSVRLSEGMVSATREFNPESLGAENKQLIEQTTLTAFQYLEATGAPRFDFYGNKQTGQVWLNEINPMPGSYGYFLWEAADDTLSFTDLTSALIDEAVAQSNTRKSFKYAAQDGKSKLFG